MARKGLRAFASLAGIALALSCSRDPRPGPEPPYYFSDATAEAGLDRFVQTNGSPEKPFIVETVGGGVALFDCDCDGDLDAYLANGSELGGPTGDGDPRDALFQNDGRGRFSDVTAAAGLGHPGWTNGVRVVDLDGDGWSDLYLTCYGPNVLYRNVLGGFTDVTAESGIDDPRWSTGSAFLDHDRDGDLDLYVANYVDFDEERMLAERPQVSYRGIDVMKGPRGLPPARDGFYVNTGDWHFRDASEETGVAGPALFGFQCVAFDADEDGWIDVYVANDSVANLLWHNVGGERFQDRAVLSGLAFSMSGKEQAGMGIAVGDYDGDQIVDVFVTNFSDDYFTLYRGTGRGFFVDATQRSNLGQVTKTMLGWSCGFEDFDNDGDLELFAVNGHVYPQVDRFDLGLAYRQQNQLFDQADGRFRVPEGEGGPGFALEKCSRGAAIGDVDGDGDLDLLIGNIDDVPTLLRNDGRSGHWIDLLLVGAGGNRDAVGARVTVRVGGRSHLLLVGTASGFLSSSDPRLHVGLGEAGAVDGVEVVWPDGHRDTFRGYAAGQLVTIEEVPGGEGRASARRLVPSEDGDDG